MLGSSARLKRDYGGTWDGGSRELHGLIEYGTRRFKVEVLARKDGSWVANIFEGGTCLASHAGLDPCLAVAGALEQMP